MTAYVATLEARPLDMGIPSFDIRPTIAKVAKRPEGVDPETWHRERARVWARRNRILNVLMLAAIVAVLIRYCGP
jgi:hypothetical protein